MVSGWPYVKNYLELVQQHFQGSITTKQLVIKFCLDQIIAAGLLMIKCLKANHKILACGNGGSAADAQHFAAELIGRFEKERCELPVIAITTDTSVLTAISNDYGYSQIFSKQIAGLGSTHDVLLAISTSGNSINIIKAIEMAHNKNISIVALTSNNGKNNNKISGLLTNNDINICIPATRTSYIQESHLTVIHCLCSIIDHHYA